MKLAAGTALANGMPLCAKQSVLPPVQNGVNLSYRSPFFSAQLASSQPNLLAFSVDSLGQNKLDSNVMLPLPASSLHYFVTRNTDVVEYRINIADPKPAWSFAFSKSGFAIRSITTPGNPTEPVVLLFDPTNTHSTLLGLINDDGMIRLPALLHFPAHGTRRITSAVKDTIVEYDASRDHGDNFVRISLPPSTWTWHSEIEYRFEVTAIYPNGDGIDADPRYDEYRRDFLSIFQLNPRRRALSNNSASDATPITVFEYSMMAERMPPLAEGLTAFDLVRQTLDRYIGGMTGYGMTGYMLPPRVAYDFLDV